MMGAEVPPRNTETNRARKRGAVRGFLQGMGLGLPEKLPPPDKEGKVSLRAAL